MSLYPGTPSLVQLTLLFPKVSVVPVIAKADCLTKKEIAALKIRILDEIAENGIKIYSLPDCDSDEDEEYKVDSRDLKG